MAKQSKDDTCIVRECKVGITTDVKQITLGVGYQYLTALKGSWSSDLPSTNTSLLGKMMKTIPEVSVRPSEQYQLRPFKEDPRVGVSVVFRHP